MAILLGSLIGVLLTLLVGSNIDFGIVTFNNARLVALVSLFGIVGASLSAMQRVSRRGRMRVPDLRAAAVASVVRSLSGAGAALVALAAAQAGLLGDEAGAVLIASFAAGFSERFILRFISDPGATEEDGSQTQANGAEASKRSDARARSTEPSGPSLPEENSDTHELHREPETYFRASVGAAILNRENQVLVLEREDHPGSWQLPQGGIEPGETPRDAVFRELREEAGLDESSVDLLDEIPGWLAYELPLDSQSAKTGRGQTQRWFLFRLRDPLAKIETQSTSPPAEFTSSKWVSPNELVSAAVEFRQPTYREIVRAIEELDT